MKTISLILAFNLSLFTSSFSDAGNCVKYEVEVKLKDGYELKGLIYVIGYNPKFTFEDMSFYEYVVENAPDSIHLYRNIHKLNFPLLKKGDCVEAFDATLLKDMVTVSKSDIKSINLRSYTICKNCDVANEKAGYYWNGISPAVITELNQKEISFLQTEPVASLTFAHSVDWYLDEYWIISYSQEYDVSKLQQLKKEFLSETDQQLLNHKLKQVEFAYQQLKAKLRELDIVIFRMHLTE